MEVEKSVENQYSKNEKHVTLQKEGEIRFDI